MGLVASILLKDVPPDLHRRLKERAERERRSLQQETILVLQHGIGSLEARRNPLPPPVPVRMKVPLTNDFLMELKGERDERDGRR